LNLSLHSPLEVGPGLHQDLNIALLQAPRVVIFKEPSIERLCDAGLQHRVIHRNDNAE